jgi:hypothetical protein
MTQERHRDGRSAYGLSDTTTCARQLFNSVAMSRTNHDPEGVAQSVFQERRHAAAHDVQQC